MSAIRGRKAKAGKRERARRDRSLTLAPDKSTVIVRTRGAVTVSRPERDLCLSREPRVAWIYLYEPLESVGIPDKRTAIAE